MAGAERRDRCELMGAAANGSAGVGADRGGLAGGTGAAVRSDQAEGAEPEPRKNAIQTGSGEGAAAASEPGSLQEGKRGGKERGLYFPPVITAWGALRSLP